jgi:Helix-turn-helix domain
MDEITMTEAAEQLGVSLVKLRSLVRDGVLPVRDNPLDKRQKLVPVSAVEELQSQGKAARTPRKHTE